MGKKSPRSAAAIKMILALAKARRRPPLILLFCFFFFVAACAKKSKTVQVENFSVIYTTTVLGEIEPCG